MVDECKVLILMFSTGDIRKGCVSVLDRKLVDIL